ncbi:alpha/beta hydrolase [Piscinibacter sp. XHJ-5]|uniref:alpha/beta fold hydrolase n=1 Tax=Piscinibacter sp. XHJ-5 TaxID=3037797 RepID=UPI002452CDF8|nr:alpha/beta hydrolase [Piscinibacter sp. XHJ-5]
MALQLIDKLAVEDEGDGDAVICVHGLGGTSNTFTPLMGALSRFRVVRPDLPGSGRSHAAMPGPLSIQRMAEAVQTVCSRLGIARAHFVAHSMGTIVCQHLATMQPALVRSLALFGPLMAPADAARTAIRSRGIKARDEGASGMHEIALALVQAATSADTRTRQPVAAAFVRESLMRQDPAGYARSCEALAEAPPAPVERIEVQALLVTGDEDIVAPPQAVRVMAERMKRARVVVLHRCGHWTPLERSEECARELRDFLAAQR